MVTEEKWTRFMYGEMWVETYTGHKADLLCFSWEGSTGTDFLPHHFRTLSLAWKDYESSFTDGYDIVEER